MEAPSHATVVAFEGNPDIISTQLRLLPKAPQLLVLPSIQTYMPKNRRKQSFDARTYIREVHEAAEVRLKAANEFLHDPTSETKKLVFLNGGTVTAQALCLAAISEFQTAGNLKRADEIFGELVKDGLAGLREDYQARRTRLLGLNNNHDASSDPITRAMQAAELLDSETASLQPSNDIDLTTTSPFRRRRSLSLPIYRYSEHMEGALPFYVFGARQSWDAMSNRTSKYSCQDDMSNRYSKSSFRDDSNRNSKYSVRDDIPILPAVNENYYRQTFLFPPKSPSCIGEAYRRFSGISMATTNDGYFASHPSTPGAVVYGEARAIHLGPANRRQTLRRSYSLDRASLRRPLSYAESFHDLQRPSKDLTSSNSTESKICLRTNSHRIGIWDPTRPHTSYSEQPRPVLSRGRQQTQHPRKILNLTQFQSFSRNSSYTDRGTDARSHQEDAEFEPVLPVVEDIVIYFTQQENNKNSLDYVLQTFKDGAYPINRSTATSEADDPAPTTPTSEQTATMESVRTNWGQRLSVEITPTQSEEYDPYSSHGECQYNADTWTGTISSKPIMTTLLTKPKSPTPMHTPHQSATSAFEKKLHDFDTSSCQTAVSLQNSLRVLLNQVCPLEEAGYNKIHFPLLPDMNGLWQPIFRESSSSSNKGKSRVDQIVAIGSQRGVKKEFVSTITGKLEMLGSKQCGLSRSGRLELRYLIASAMQVFTAQPLANQTHDNPFTNPYLLATLIVPHLETYLAMNSNIRFLLLEYAPEHLSTALALQKLVGVPLFKVAGIINMEPSLPNLPSLPSGMSPTPSVVGGLSAISLPTSPREKTSTPNFSKPTLRSGSSLSPSSGSHLEFSNANFLLASSSSEREVASFVQTIWKILAEASSYYSLKDLPIEARGYLRPRQPKCENTSPPGSAGNIHTANSTITALSRQDAAYSTGLDAKVLSQTMNPSLDDCPPSPILISSAAIETTTIKAGSKTRHDRLKNLFGISPPATSWGDSTHIRKAIPSVRSNKTGRTMMTDFEDGASFFDFADDKAGLRNEQRRLMPLYERRKTQRSSLEGEKALKWLGIN